ncbi:ABC transporter permease [Klugiella xanthotipulae]|uniref:ABC-2 family transporter n=1 Tax=Klugiella xanthotipulae TaxID=244735 RepID=A0A543I756_9MICO|nr:ABC transporter permease [Klugiella xanthotipulae]TQM66407.1 hypothetical protein FB466_1247 [Klugiella xanthotipulae]
MNSLIGALSSEMRKVTSTRLWWILGLVVFVYVAFTAASLAGIAGAADSGLLDSEAISGQGIPLDPPLIYSFASSLGFVFPLILAAVSVTQEFRHKTVNPTFLATPNRAVVLTAKAITMFLWGAVVGAFGVVASVGLGGGILALFGSDPLLGESDTWALIGRMLLALALWGAIGVGLGALIPSQIAVIAVVLAFTQFVEPLLRFAATLTEWSAGIGAFLPGAASDALVGTSFYTMTGGATNTLDWWQGALVLLGLALVTGCAGYLVSWRRDVT